MKQNPEIRIIKRPGSRKYSVDFYWTPYEGAKRKRIIRAIAKTKEDTRKAALEIAKRLNAGTFNGSVNGKDGAVASSDMPKHLGGVVDAAGRRRAGVRGRDARRRDGLFR